MGGKWNGTPQNPEDKQSIAIGNDEKCNVRLARGGKELARSLPQSSSLDKPCLRLPTKALQWWKSESSRQRRQRLNFIQFHSISFNFLEDFEDSQANLSCHLTPLLQLHALAQTSLAALEPLSTRTSRRAACSACGAPKRLEKTHMQGGQHVARQVLRLLPASHHIKGTLKTHVVHVVFFF